MVITLHPGGCRHAAMMIELVVALALLLGALLPLAYSVASEKRLARSLYQRAVALEIVDGEAEILAAGQARAFTPGTHQYPVHAAAGTNLPPGRFLLTISPDKRFRLEWQPLVKQSGGPVVREGTIR